MQVREYKTDIIRADVGITTDRTHLTKPRSVRHLKMAPPRLAMALRLAAMHGQLRAEVFAALGRIVFSGISIAMVTITVQIGCTLAVRWRRHC